MPRGHHNHIRQLGNVVLHDDVEIGACSTVDNSAMNSTVVGRGTKIDNLVHLGHNVEVGEDCFLCAQVGVAGSTKIGNHCILAGQAGITGHIHIVDNVILGGKTGVIGISLNQVNMWDILQDRIKNGADPRYW